MEKPAQFRRLSLKNPEIPSFEAFAVNNELEYEERSNSNSEGSGGNSDIEEVEETRKELPLPNNGESLKFFLKKKDLMINMAIMTLVWISVLYNYTLIQFMLTTFKREYLASCFSAIADIIGYLLGAWFYYKMGLK